MTQKLIQLGSQVEGTLPVAQGGTGVTSSTGTGAVVLGTSPTITTPSGLVKGDVGLGNVDNTSDATKNAAAVTLTNKTLTSPVINTPTGIVKGDVGLGNVDNTSDSTKNSAVATLTNKDLTSGTNTFPTLNQNTTGSAAKWTTARTLAGNSVDGSANVAFANKFIVQGTSDSGLSAAQFLGALSTGIMVVTTTTGAVTSIAAPSGTIVGTSDSQTLINKDLTSGTNTFPTFNQNTTGSAAKLTTARNIAGVAFDGTANISLASTNLSDTASIVLLTSTQTLTNKRWTRRVVTVTQAAAPTMNTDNMDVASITGLAQAVTSFTTNLTGTPVDGDTLVIRVTDNGTARGLTFGASFEASTIALPTTTVISTMLTIGFIWNTATTKWRCVAVA